VTRWTFGVEPLPQQQELAPILRRVNDLVQSLEAGDPAVTTLIDQLRAAEVALSQHASADSTPRLGIDAPPDRRPYVDHARDIGAYNACFPQYEIAVDDTRAAGAVTFPISFEGPPGIVHGGVLATFFDCVVQHHNCDVGVAGKTTSLHIDYRRPTPLAVPLRFEIERTTDDRRMTATARLFRDEVLLCTASLEAVAGDVSNVPHVPPRRMP
jgi:acyl-coenzyme A thioesterase PaaI-like protein